MSAPSSGAGSSGHLLHSRNQIARVLDALAVKGETVTVELAGERGPFSSRFIRADPGGQSITIAMTADPSANAALLALGRVTFVSAPGDWRIEFVATGPHKVMYEGKPAISLGYPEVLTVQQRRQYLRALVPPTVPIRCVADAQGIMPFDAQIDDISVGGISLMLYPPDIKLEPGTVLVGCRIEAPGFEPVITDLEVRYSEVVTLADGKRARCSGFRFVNALASVQRFVDAIEKR